MLTVERVRRAGFTDGEIADNNTAAVEVDFPKIAIRQSA